MSVPTLYDRRAERLIAAGIAAQQEAAAAAVRAETELRLRQAARDDARQEAAERDRARRDRAYRWKTRRAELAASAVRSGPLLAGGIAMGAPIILAWSGQLAFGRDIMLLGPLAPAVPVALEGAVWYVAYLIHRASEAGLPTGVYRAWAWILAGVAAGMNYWHGATSAGGAQRGAVLALASLLGVGLWELTVRLRERRQRGRTVTEARTAAWRRLRYPILSWNAGSIRSARGCTIGDAWTAAWIDRYGLGPDSTRRDRRIGRSIVKARLKADRVDARDGRLVIVDGSIVRKATPDPRSAEAGEEALSRLRAFQADRENVARSILGAGFGRRPAPRPIDRPAPILAPVPPIETDRPSAETIDPGTLLDLADPEQAAAPRRSIEQHRIELRRRIDAGEIDRSAATAEDIRKALRCSPATARTLRDELRGAA
ncbi:DUF2637 domain-containing protein [Planomonospora venezuelensis]|uniref:DUF2637 domain-containing protein n=1 Tax=Planomonospora venezuelensis TaxID=1999 RepID=UPI0031E86546